MAISSLVTNPAPKASSPSVKPVSAPTYTPGMVSSSGYDATPYKVEPQGLVQNQVKDIVAQDSPLMQQAARIATQKSNARGLINSSMAVGDAQQAVISQAMPIAQADANAYNQAMTNTANQQNAASQFTANASNQAALANQAATNEALKAQQQGSIQLTGQKMTNDAQIALANLDAATKVQLTNLDNRTRSLLQSNQSASNAYVQTIQNINQIQNNPQMNAAAKQKAIDNQLALLQEQYKQISAQDAAAGNAIKYPDQVTSLNLGNFFDPAKDPGIKTFNQGAYDAAVAEWKDAQARHQARYGVPIPTTAYKAGYKPPKKEDFYS